LGLDLKPCWERSRPSSSCKWAARNRDALVRVDGKILARKPRRGSRRESSQSGGRRKDAEDDSGGGGGGDDDETAGCERGTARV
jgi:hypothetical protein